MVAVVQGKDLLRGDVRKPTEYRQAKDESLTKNQATKLNIVPLVDGLIILAEVERRKLLPTDKETAEYMQPHREACLGEHGADCRAEITSLGYSVDEYWEVAFEDYKTALGDIRLHQAVFEETRNNGCGARMPGHRRLTLSSPASRPAPSSSGMMESYANFTRKPWRSKPIASFPGPNSPGSTNERWGRDCCRP